MSLLNIKNLTVSIADKTILSNLNFAIEKGKTLALLGESGIGKSLTALSIMGLLPPTATVSNDSVIEFKGEDLLALPEITLQKIRGRRMGMIFQEPMTALNPVMTIGTQISEVITRHLKLSKKAAHLRTLELLYEVGLTDTKRFYTSYPHQLSGGMRQRAVIAMAIAAQPDLLIADEPTSALDISTESQILKLLKELQSKFGMAILFITHDVKIAERLGDEVINLSVGATGRSSSFRMHTKKGDQPVAPTIQIKNLSIYFSDTIKAVDDVSLNLYAGQTLALVGESGCGKTTLARGILRLIEPTAGTIKYQGTELIHLPKNKLRLLRKDLQIIFQDPYSSLDPRMLVTDIIAEGLWALNLISSKQDQIERVSALLKQVGLSPDIQYRYPHEFSGGQRQRIVIARALAVKPKIIICDEPTSALDIKNQNQIMDLLLQLQNDLALGYLFITHNIPLAATVASEIAVMYQGKIIEHGAMQEVLHSPQHSYTQTLIDLSQL